MVVGAVDVPVDDGRQPLSRAGVHRLTFATSFHEEYPHTAG
jgi:hypothetical protein